MISKLEGIIISETPYGESSKIINVFTKDKGIIGVMCKGAKSIKNPLRAKTQKFTYAYFHIKYKEDHLSILIDVEIIDSLFSIRNDIEKISYMTYITELTSQVVKQNNEEALYGLYKSVVLKLNEGHDPLILTNILELKYLAYLGVGLNLDCCIQCGNQTDIVTIDPDAGGFICRHCYRGEKILSPKTIKLIRMYYLIAISSIKDIKISPDTANEINYFLDKYYERYTGLYLKSKDFLVNIRKIA